MLLVFACLFAFIISGCGKNGGAQSKTPPAPVIVSNVSKIEIASSETFVGKVDAAVKASITARVNGFLEMKLVKEGDMVKKDQILFTIEKTQYEAAVKQAEAALAQAQANAKNVGLQRERAEALLDSASIAQSKYDDVVAADNVAKANVASARAMLENARLNLSYTEVRSPIDGKIGLINANIGETVGPASGVIANVIATENMYVLFSVTDRQLQSLRKKYGSSQINSVQDISKVAELGLVLSNGDPYPIKGSINFVDNAVQSTTDSIRIRGAFTNPDGLLAQGQTVTVKLIDKNAEMRLAVPQVAVQTDLGGKYVFVMGENNVPVRRIITVGEITPEGSQVVLSGLSESDVIVIDGIQKIRPGAPVSPMTKEQYDQMLRDQAMKAQAVQGQQPQEAPKADAGGKPAQGDQPKKDQNAEPTKQNGGK